MVGRWILRGRYPWITVRKQVRLTVVPDVDVESWGTSLTGVPDGKPYLEGTSSDATDFLCGQCGYVLAEAVYIGEVVDSYMQCPDCDRWNLSP